MWRVSTRPRKTTKNVIPQRRNKNKMNTFTEITYCRNTERREDMLTFTAYSLVNNPIATGEIWEANASQKILLYENFMI